MPEVSVLMSIYNERYNDIEKAVNSVLKQTFKDFEFIIVIDEPSRANLASMLEARDPRIKIYLNKENIGLAKSMNRAAELADGKYLARMDADDVSLPQRLEKEYKSIIE